ncbi:MAG: pentapeptide repeat-containing protein [Actinomycetota bacterium]
MAARAQGLGAIATAATAAFALFAVLQAREAVGVASAGVERQAEENRLSIAMDSIGAGKAAERVGGFTILRRHVETMLEEARNESPEEKRETLRLFDTSLDILENYVKTPVVSKGAVVAPVTLGDQRGWGWPSVPTDVRYAAAQLKLLLEHGDEVSRLSSGLMPETVRHVYQVLPEPASPHESRDEDAESGGDDPPPRVDLSNVQLQGQSWPRIDFSWLSSFYAPGIDLRAANLEDSIWGKPTGQGITTLSGAYLQCANASGADFRKMSASRIDFRGAALPGADFRKAELWFADFRDTDLSGADFRGADLSGARFGGANLMQTKLADAKSLAGITGLPRTEEAATVQKTPSRGTWNFKLPDRFYKVHTQTPGQAECMENESYWTTVEGGSVEDLSQRLDELELPASFVTVEDRYTRKCKAVCPALERWYEIEGSLRHATKTLASEFRGEATKLEPKGDDGVLTVRLDNYVYAIKFGRRADNGAAPDYVDINVSVSRVEET